MATDSRNKDNGAPRAPWSRLLKGLMGKRGEKDGDARPVPPAGAGKPADARDAEATATPAAPAPATVAKQPAHTPVEQAFIDLLSQSTKEFESVIAKSQDPLAALADYAGHAEGPCRDLLAPLLAATRALEGPLPKGVSVSRLRRNKRWWVASREDLAPAEYDRLLSAEIALNIFEDIKNQALVSGCMETESLPQAVAYAFDNAAALLPCGEAPKQPEKGEWFSRGALAKYLENLPAPSRVTADFQMDVEGHAAVIDVEVMRPAALAVCSLVGGADLTRQARAYAFRLCLLVGKAAFACADGLTRVVVNGREAQTGYPLLSLDLARAGLEALLDAAAEPGAIELPRTLGVRFQDNAAGWLEPVRPFAQRGDELVAPAWRWDPVEMNPGPCPAPIVEACHAKSFCDLGINEKAVRVAAWNEMAPNLGITTRQSVAKLVEMREKTPDASVAAACARASEALVEGNVDAADKQALAQLFVDGSDLACAVREVNRLEAEADADRRGFTADALEGALDLLKGALDPVTQTGAYLDDSKTVYRYFNSVAERVSFNEKNTGESRRVSLVPDEYYAAHSQASRILCALDRPDEGLAFADEAVRMAPVCTDAVLAKVRCLENSSRLFEAAEVLTRAIDEAVSAKDMSVCFYRLAYMQWRLGRFELAGACYQRAIELNREVGAQARLELKELLAAQDDARLLTGEEVRATLKAAAIPYGDAEKIRNDALVAAGLCVDAQVFSVAQPLLGVALEAGHDDALADVYRSLSAPMPEG